MNLINLLTSPMRNVLKKKRIGEHKSCMDRLRVCLDEEFAKGDEKDEEYINALWTLIIAHRKKLQEQFGEFY